MSGDWLLRSTLGRREKVKERISPQGRKGVDTRTRRKRKRWRTRMGARPSCPAYLVRPCLCALRYILSEISRPTLFPAPSVAGPSESQKLYRGTISAYLPTYRHRRNATGNCQGIM